MRLKSALPGKTRRGSEYSCRGSARSSETVRVELIDKADPDEGTIASDRYADTYR